MKLQLNLHLIIGVAAATAAIAGSVYARQEASEIVLGNDRYIAADRIDFNGVQEGELFAVGGQADIAGQVIEDLLVAAETVRLEGVVGDDARLAGRTVMLERAAVTGTAMLAGATVIVDAGSSVGQSLVAAGETVEVAGNILGGARLAGNQVRIDGRIDGPVELAGQTLIVGPQGRIDGPIRYSSPADLVIQPGAAVAGAITRMPYEQSDWSGAPTGGGLGFAIIVGLGLGLAAYLFERVYPRAMEPVAATLEANPWKSLATGLAGMVLGPLVAVMLLVTVLGAPLSLLTLAFWGVALLVSRLFVGLYLAERIVASRHQEATPKRLAGWTFLTVLGLTLLVAIPVLGWLLRVALIGFGFGALLITLWQWRKGRPTDLEAGTSSPVGTRPEPPVSSWPATPVQT